MFPIEEHPKRKRIVSPSGVVIRRKKAAPQEKKKEPLLKELERAEQMFIALYGDLRRAIRKERYSGEMFERNVLGAPDADPVIKEGITRGALKEKKTPEGKSLYIIKYGNEEAVFDMVKKHQGTNNPQAPKKLFPRALKRMLSDKLGYAGAEESRKVQYYSSIGTPLDHSLWIDCFFEIIDKDQNRVTVTLDTSLREEKGEGVKSDVYLSEDDIWSLHEELLVRAIEKKEKNDNLNERESLAVNIFELQVEAVSEKMLQSMEHKKRSQFF